MSLLTPAEAAKKLKVSPITLRKWADAGLIEVRTTIGGHRRYLASEVEGMLARQGSRKGRETKILIVDDDVMMIELVRDLLLMSSRPFAIETALDGFDAGRKLAVFQPDLMFLDLMMPGLDGFEVCRRVKSSGQGRKLRIIAMTAYPTEENVRRIEAEGAEVCLAKPVSQPLLMAAIDRSELSALYPTPVE